MATTFHNLPNDLLLESEKEQIQIACDILKADVAYCHKVAEKLYVMTPTPEVKKETWLFHFKIGRRGRIEIW